MVCCRLSELSFCGHERPLGVSKLFPSSSLLTGIRPSPWSCDYLLLSSTHYIAPSSQPFHGSITRTYIKVDIGTMKSKLSIIYFGSASVTCFSSSDLCVACFNAVCWVEICKSSRDGTINNGKDHREYKHFWDYFRSSASVFKTSADTSFVKARTLAICLHTVTLSLADDTELLYQML